MVTIQKSTTSDGNKVRVTFTMPAIESCDCLYLVGKFYEWNESVYRMQHADDGTWSLTLELESNREIQYRFRTCDGTWLNDPSALHGQDRFGAEISLVCTPSRHCSPEGQKLR
jgi:1,4-alpha-glucan branching enzyme